ncbi:SDR family NAD(P)-dependent oxidoreductase [Scopulibacillus cellulosilyticus]|uniref:SDR family NAD(P)-dependent oxidoreductase n=1 Tax=Scopulibacillus cellulosilyticus TaxID=2665665 RepID=A0ABW2Q2C0_9BACL
MSNPSLKNQIIIITGASSGIGKQMAIAAARKGAFLILMARSLDKLQIIQKDINDNYGVEAEVHAIDVSDTNAVQHVFSKIFNHHGHIDALINNAGFGVFDYFAEADPNDIKKMFEVNVIGLMNCTRMVVPYMLKSNKGHIINVASIAGKLATPKSTVYSASKHAVLGFTNGLRMELAGTNIHVTAVNPGPIRTNFFDIADPSGQYIANVGRFMVEPEKVAHKVVDIIGTNTREVNIPWTMSTGARLYQIFPRLVEKIAGNLLSKK